MAIEAINLLWFLLIGLIAGWLADVLVPGIGFGLLGDMIVGVIGAYIGGLVFGFLGFGTEGGFGVFLAALVGAILLLVIIKAVRRNT